MFRSEGIQEGAKSRNHQQPPTDIAAESKKIPTYSLFKELKEVKLQNGNGSAASAVSDNALLYGDQQGYIHVCKTNNSQVGASIEAFNGAVKAILFSKQELNSYSKQDQINHKIFIAIGEEYAERVKGGMQRSDLKHNLCIKIFEIDITDLKISLKSSGVSILPKTIEEPVGISSFDLCEEDSSALLAVAIDAKKSYFGAVFVFKLEIYNSKISFLNKIEMDATATGLGLCKQDFHNYTLFLSTTENVRRCLVNTNSHGEKSTYIYDNRGCPIGCAVMHHSKNEFIMADKNGVYKYKVNIDPSETIGSGISMATEKENKCEILYNVQHSPQKPVKIGLYSSNYILLVTKEGSSSSCYRFTIFNFGESDNDEKFKAFEKRDMHYVHNIALDIKKKKIYVITDDCAYKIEEKDTASKLEFLIKKYNYELAIREAEEHGSQQYSDTYVTETKQKYGDYLFSQGNYREAVKRYSETIGQLEPSYVIRKLLDSKKNSYLIEYLEELHAKKHYNNEHTTLLLNCYAKLRDGDQDNENILTSFSKGNDEAKKRIESFLFYEDMVPDKNHVNYDPITAINVLRQIGYREIALKLAEKFSGSGITDELLIKIHLEDYLDEETDQHFKEALQILESLEFKKAERFLREKQFAKTLITRLPYCTTNLLIRLCSKTFQPIPRDRKEKQLRKIKHIPTSEQNFFGTDRLTDNSSDNSVGTDIASSKDFIYAYADQSFWLMVFLENVIHRTKHFKDVDLPPVVFNTLLEIYLKYWEAQEIENREDINFSAVVNYKKLCELLEKPLTELDDDYEIESPYPSLITSPFEKKIMRFLEEFQGGDEDTDDDNMYDKEHALMLIQSTKKPFEQGMLFVYRKLKLFYDILQHYMERDDFENVFETCKTYGVKNPSMWIQVLSYFSNHKEYSKTEEYLHLVLRQIKQHGYLPPLLVVQILSENENMTLSLVKEFLRESLCKEQEKTQVLSRKIKEMQDATSKLQLEVDDLRTKAKEFHLSTCSACQKPLDLPAVHFMCMHSYHQRCLDDDVEECKKCAPKNKEAIMISKKCQLKQKNDDQFFEMLSGTSDGFEVITQYFGQGIFKPSIIME